MVTKRDDMFSDLYVFAALGFPKWWGYVAGFLCLVVAVIYFVYYLTAIGAILTIISGVMVYNTGSRRAIHDYIAKTTVVGIEEEAPVPKNRKERRKKRNKHA